VVILPLGSCVSQLPCDHLPKQACPGGADALRAAAGTRQRLGDSGCCPYPPWEICVIRSCDGRRSQPWACLWQAFESAMLPQLLYCGTVMPAGLLVRRVAALGLIFARDRC